MIDLGQNLALHHHPFHLVLLLNVFFLHRFDSVKLSSVLASHEDDLGIGALSDD